MCDDDDEIHLDSVCPNCGIEYDEIDQEYQICHYCKFNNNREPAVVGKHGNVIQLTRYCRCCKAETLQEIRFYNPDVPEDGQVYECTVCRETVDFV